MEHNSGLFNWMPLHWLLTTRQPTLAQSFREWREGFGLSQEQLAEQSGIKLDKIQNLEAGKTEGLAET